jgi:hypothetical protein
MISKQLTRKDFLRIATKIGVFGTASYLAGAPLYEILNANAYQGYKKSDVSLLITNLTDEERKLIYALNTPQKVIEWMKKYLKYDYQYDKPDSQSTVRSFRRVLRDRKAHCLEGAIFAAAILREYNYPPLIICIEAKDDSDHNIFLYTMDGKIGSIAISRFPLLWDRPPIFSSVYELVESYYNCYLDDDGKKSMRGYSQILNLNKFLKQGINWVTGEQELREIEDSLWNLYYLKLFPKDKKEYYKFTKSYHYVKIDPKLVRAGDFELTPPLIR